VRRADLRRRAPTGEEPLDERAARGLAGPAHEVVEIVRHVDAQPGASGGVPLAPSALASRLDGASPAGLTLLPSRELGQRGFREATMEPPHTPRRGEAAHDEAVEQLAEARERQRDLVQRSEAADGTPGEEQAADALGKARRNVAAREAWAVWTERGM
jgi:hypothetical protein